MGAADIVPGVSGGTMALITGIYTRLVDGIDQIFSLINLRNLKLLFGLQFAQFWQEIKKVDFAFFIPLFLGIASAIIGLAHAVEFLLSNYPAATYSGFAGLILASAIVLYRKLHFINHHTFIWILLGFVSGFGITGIEAIQASQSHLMTFVAGAIAICAMILPGISGSALLVIMGQYTHVLGAIKAFDFTTIVLFASGAVLGMGLFSHLLHYLLHHKRLATFAFLVGLILGSLRLQYSIISATAPQIPELLLYGCIGLAAAALVLFLERKNS